MTLLAFLTFTRQDGFAFSVRPSTVAAFMPAADGGTLVWLDSAASTDIQHVKDDPATVASALGLEEKIHPSGSPKAEEGVVVDTTPKTARKPKSSRNPEGRM